MAEEQIIEGESLNDQAGEVSEDTEASETDDKTYTKEEVEAIKKKLQSDSEKGVQKLIREKKEQEQFSKDIISATKKVASDNTYLIDLHEENPRVAKAILEEFYDGASIEKYKEQIGYEIDYSDPVKARKQIEKEASRIADRRLIEAHKNDFVKTLQMSDDEKEQFNEAFEERMQLKSFRAEDLQKHLEKAYREVNDDPKALQKLNAQAKLGNSIASGEGKSSGSTHKTELEKAEAIADAFFKKYGK